MSKAATKKTSRKNTGLYYSNMSLYVRRHWAACLGSLGRMSLTPFATLLTVTVIGVSMALPAGLLVLLQNAQSLMMRWQDSTDISLFLKVGTSEDDIHQLEFQLKSMPQIAKVQYISPQEGLEQFEQTAGFAHVLNGLPSNPLPPVIQIQPLFKSGSHAALSQLIETLQNMPQVDMAQFDTQWVRRLYAIVDLATAGVWALGGLLALGVVLVIGNTIRLLTQHRQQEIKVLKLIGASNGFVRRPFLYSGMLYGMFGAMTAWVFVDVILLWLNRPITALASLYQSPFEISTMRVSLILWLFFLGGFLGVVGAYVAVNRYIKAINPT